MASQGGTVDWFRFWLQDYEDPDPAKSQHYTCWCERVTISGTAPYRTINIINLVVASVCAIQLTRVWHEKRRRDEDEENLVGGCLCRVRTINQAARVSMWLRMP